MESRRQAVIAFAPQHRLFGKRDMLMGEVRKLGRRSGNTIYLGEQWIKKALGARLDLREEAA